VFSRLVPRSIRWRFSLATAALALIACLGSAITLDTLIRDRVKDLAFRDTQRVATHWLGQIRHSEVGQPSMTSRVTLVQLVDSDGRVVAASPRAQGRPPLSDLRPSDKDRIQHETRCWSGRCFMITAARTSPQESAELWHGRPHIVYAAMPQPALLADRRLEVILGFGVLGATLLAGWAAWVLVGRTLRSVEAMRARFAEISLSDLGSRVPQPPGHDEIARLAESANDALFRLQQAVRQQRHFASVVSHELRTPLAGLRAQLEEALLYAQQVDPHASIRDALATTQRLQSLIDEVATLTRIRTGPQVREPTNLTELVRQEAESRPMNVPITVRIRDDLVVPGNHLQLEEVLANLLVNAQRHARSKVEIVVERSADMAVVTVADDGAGIPSEDRETVFQPFVRLPEGRDRDPKGSGLGLAISRAIVQAHHGSLSVEDSAQGARLVIRLPLHDSETADEPSTADATW